MTQGRHPAAQAGGFLIAAGVLVGVVGGSFVGEASAGFLIGLGVGVVLALLVWWKDRR